MMRPTSDLLEELIIEHSRLPTLAVVRRYTIASKLLKGTESKDRKRKLDTELITLQANLIKRYHGLPLHELERLAFSRNDATAFFTLPGGYPFAKPRIRLKELWMDLALFSAAMDYLVWEAMPRL